MAHAIDILRSRTIADDLKDFLVFTLTVNDDRSAVLTCTDGDRGDGPVTLAIQSIEFTDFPAKEQRIWVCGRQTVLLPTEY